jgi:asparagine synthase (glutamine-hydrolysing)
MYLPDDILALTDRVGMWHSLELRVPFLDHTLVEFCARIPNTFKLRGRTKKYLLDRVARPILPPSVFNHRKQGFAAPLAIWLRGDLKESVQSSLTPSRLGALGVLRADSVRRLLTSHHERRTLNDRQILAVLMFQLWMESRAGVGYHSRAPSHRAGKHAPAPG